MKNLKVNPYYKIKDIAFHIDYSCTHKCIHCYNGECKPNKIQELEVLKRIIDELKKNEVQSLCYVGGDPAIYPYIYNLVKYGYESGITQSILSNTLGFNVRIEEIAPYFSSVETTIHGKSAEEHDTFCRTNGAYENSIVRLKAFSDIKKDVGIVVNISPYTSNDIYDIVKNIFGRGINVSYVMLQRIIPLGRATNNFSFQPSIDEVNIALSQIKKLEDEYGIDVVVCDPFPACIIPKELHKYVMPCNWGYDTASINPNGDIARCGCEPENKIGNVFERPLLEIWNDNEYLNKFRKREFLDDDCKCCDLLSICGGGCYLSTGNKGLETDVLKASEKVLKYKTI